MTNAVPFVRYRPDGLITDAGAQWPDAIKHQRQRGDRIIRGDGAPGTHWVDATGDEPVIRERKPNPAFLDGGTIRGLPVPSTVKIGAKAYEVDDGEAELSFALPGTYTVEVDSGPSYLAATFEVTA